MTKNTDKISGALEDYLEAILYLEEKQKVARVKDIADRMGILRGSVTSGLKTLSEKGLINYEPYRFITLTPKGEKIAKEITRRHKTIKAFLKDVLLIDEEVAEENACRMEHAMDKHVIDRLIEFISYVHECPRAGDDWIMAFVNYYTRKKPDRGKCKECIDNCVKRFEP